MGVSYYMSCSSLNSHCYGYELLIYMHILTYVPIYIYTGRIRGRDYLVAVVKTFKLRKIKQDFLNRVFRLTRYAPISPIESVSREPEIRTNFLALCILKRKKIQHIKNMLLEVHRTNSQLVLGKN